eukprot:6955277-Alexandrium_andersonii.AAC.1
MPHASGVRLRAVHCSLASRVCVGMRAHVHAARARPHMDMRCTCAQGPSGKRGCRWTIVVSRRWAD